MTDCTIFSGDCLDVMPRLPQSHAIVTDPPFGPREFEPDQLERMNQGTGGVWRRPPAYDGARRRPVPRFTAASPKELAQMRDFYVTFGEQALRNLFPGGHLFIASTTLLSPLVYGALMESGLEYRGQIVRMVRSLRGGDRPKGAESRFPDVSTMLAGSFEPWGVLRRPLPKGMTVADCLATHATGGLRRGQDGSPLSDVIPSGRTPARERRIAPHPSLKPQAFMRRICWSALPLGTGVVLDPFAGAGATLAACIAIGYDSAGIERHEPYHQMALSAVPLLAELEA